MGKTARVCCGLVASAACLVAPLEAAQRAIPFKVSSQMWYAPSGRLVPTPEPIVEKIKKIFELWATVKEAGLEFRYGGLVTDSFKGFGEIPRDGTVYIILNNWDMGHCNDGLGEHWGALPGAYKGGAAVINTQKGLHNLRVDVLTHEIGHSLGIETHGASPSNAMSEVGHAWNINEYVTLSEEDRAELIARWNPDFKDLRSISGAVVSARTGNKTSAFAVDITNGHAYSAEVDSNGAFTIRMLRNGDYRVFAKEAEALSYQTPVSQSPSWYRAGQRSTNDPYAGTVLHLDANTPKISQITISLIDTPVPFNFFSAGQTYGKTDPFCFIRPGAKTRFDIEYFGIVSVEPYGSHPDYSFSNLQLEPQFKQVTFLDIAVDAGAEPGERLVLARGAPGMPVQAGLIGVNVVINQPPRISLGSVKDIEAQLAGKVDFAAIQIPTQ